jgi:hypothetical protein
MAALAKYPNRNVQLRQGERIIKRHDGEPTTAPPAPVAPNLKSWSAHLIRGRRMELLGYIEASDETAATLQAIRRAAQAAGDQPAALGSAGAKHREASEIEYGTIAYRIRNYRMDLSKTPGKI